MEHLPLPRDPIKGHAAIKLASKQFHDPGPFLKYGERFGHLLRGSYPHVPTQVDALEGRIGAGVSSCDVLDYYQGWLFFALLQEFLGDLYKVENYLDITQAQDGSIESICLSTKTLHQNLVSWRMAGRLATIKTGDEYHKHVDECLDAVESAFSHMETKFPGFAEAFPDEMLCFAALAETLDSAITTALEQGPLDATKGQEEKFPSQANRAWLKKVYSIVNLNNSEPKSRMLQAGWCPGDISRVIDSFSSIAALYFFGKFKADTAPASENLHKDCKSYGCTLSIPAEPKHLTPNCTCPGLFPLKENRLIEIYEKGCIPCVSMGRLDDGSLGLALSAVSLDETSQRDPANHYIALSHVWSEGMGNPHANAITVCQLSRTQYWAMLAYQTVEEKEENDNARAGTTISISSDIKKRQINLWIDTICCPVTPGYGKNICLARMREIYSNAYAVLVRSASLEAMPLSGFLHEPNKGIADIAARVYTSPWYRRMWTLQEGVLAGVLKGRGNGERLCFLFQDCSITLESIVLLLKRAAPHEAAFAFDMIGKFGQLSAQLWNLDDRWYKEGRPSFFFLGLLNNALKFRGVSVASDEPICLATLLGLRISSTHGPLPLVGDGQTPEQGMCVLWRLVETHSKGIPGDIIFSSVPRIEVPGFRWAPRTFIQNARYGRLYSSNWGGPARITEKGLEVRAPGVRLSVMEPSGLYGKYLLAKRPIGGTDGGDTVPENVDSHVMPLMIQMPASGDNWYVVHRSDEWQKQARPQPDAYETLKSGKAALVFRTLSSTTVGIFVTVLEQAPSSDVPVEVRTQFPVSINQLQVPASEIISGAQRCISRLYEAVGAEASLCSNISTAEIWQDDKVIGRLLRDTAAQMIASEKSLSEALYFEELSKKASTTHEKILDSFVDCVDKVARCGGVAGSLVDDQLWCVD